MQLSDFHFLLGDDGQALLAELAGVPLTAENHLRLASELRQRVGPARAQAVLETMLLRQRAQAKFSRAGAMYFTRAALEQASAEPVAAHRARRYAAAGFGTVADLGCGIGGDALALAAAADVVGVDWQPLRLAMAQENVRVYGHESSFQPLQADLLALSPLPVDALFADPGRRDEHGRRIFSVHEYRPPLRYLEGWRAPVPHQGVKVSPAIDYDELPPQAEVEFISYEGEVREGVLWFGDLRGNAGRRATLLPGGHSLTDDAPATVPLTPPRRYLYEPDGAVIRAHLVEQLGARLGAAKLDESIAYLTADTARSTPFARCFELYDAFPFQLKRLRHYLRQRNVGQVTIKKRGSPLDPDHLRRQLRLQGEERRIIFLTQVVGQPTVLIGDLWQPAAG
ncbi:MAG: methyltransferase domain-containing protein [Candidatus Promineifilaceae bacterium]|nr:methyltransferase domain-containing protein [Candidatus Promineifilaceae bacterium]